MEKTLFLVIALAYSSGAVNVFYVKPTVPTTECPSGDSPCRSLQYYANHSSFTNNSRFLFLEGEHHLDSVVEISDVANLSLVSGASLGVKILCKSISSGFHIKQFINLSVKNIELSNCSGYGNATMHLATGSEVSLDHITITNTSGYDASGVRAIDVVGSLSISNFTSMQGDKIQVSYSVCNAPSYLMFSHNSFNSELSLGIECSDVHLVIADSAFQNDKITGLSVYFDIVTKNTITITNTVFNSAISISTCFSDCDESNLRCTPNFLAFDRNHSSFLRLFSNWAYCLNRGLHDLHQRF